MSVIDSSLNTSGLPIGTWGLDQLTSRRASRSNTWRSRHSAAYSTSSTRH